MENLLLKQNLGRLWASLIINELVKSGVKNFYLSPGLRNAPLIAALENHPHAFIKLGIDERAQAFRALGFAKATGFPGVLVCTSGTALANYLPAVMEAKKSSTPLIILSADRPADLVYSGDNQTINQNAVFGDFIQGSFNPGAPTTEVDPRSLTTSIANLINRAMFPTKGPVHINCPFREPLDESERPIPEDYLETSYQALRKEITFFNPSTGPSENDLRPLIEKLSAAENPILVVGAIDNTGSIEELLNNWQGAFYLDVCSSLKYKYNISKGAIPSLDHPEVLNILTKNPPDLILHLGGRLVSKHYYQFLKSNPEITLVTVNNQLEKEDPSHSTTIRYNFSPDIWAKKMVKFIPEIPNFSIPWKSLVEKKIKIINEGPLTFPMVSKELMEWIPNDSTLYIGNSTAIRSFDSYCSLENTKNLNIVHHRGVSGIEGFIAGACGASEALKNRVTLVLGDISFLHDLNSLMLLKDSATPPIILVVNNGGGGIFSLLPIAREEKIMPYMLTEHEYSFSHLASQFSINYKKALNIKELESYYSEALKSKSPCLIEIVINNEENISIYQKLKTVKL